MTWAVKWISDSPLDGHREYLLGAANIEKPPALSGCNTLLFLTRRMARNYISETYGYIAKRKDLKLPPHCWKMPKAVKVIVDIQELSNDGSA